MKFVVLAVLMFLVIAGPSSQAQLAIENPRHLQVPEQKASLLLNTACRVVAEKFRLSNQGDHLLSLKLVLGSKDEHYTADADKDAYTLFLERWDESKFAEAVTDLAIQRLVVRDHLVSLVTEVLRRSAQVTPVPVTELRENKTSGQQLRGSQGLGQPSPSETSGCLSSVTEAAVRNIPCGPLSNPVPSSSTFGARPR